MDEITVDTIAEPTMEEPIFIEGLPGVGLVGKLAVDQLVEELEGEPIAHLYSEHLPPGVSVQADGIAELASMTLHHLETDSTDLLVLAGDSQAEGGVGQYRLAGAVLDLIEQYDCREAITLGGFGTGDQIEEYTVVGAVGDQSDDLKDKLTAAGVDFNSENAPTNIVGMSGLVLGLGALRGIPTAGLLGLTPGYYVDPASSRAVLRVLQDAYDFDVSLETLEQQAEQIQELLEKLQSMQQQEQQPSQSGEDLRYFG